MKQLLRIILVPFTATLLMFAGSFALVTPAGAANPLDDTCKGQLTTSQVCRSRNDKLFGANSFWTRLINTMIMVVGLVATLMIIIGGLRYVLSGGDASQTKSAKDTILYSIIGIVIALMSYAIVNFVVVELV